MPIPSRVFLIALSLLAAASAARADVVTAEYRLPENLGDGGMSLDYFQFGYEGPNGWEVLTGYEIVESRFQATFTPNPGTVLDDLLIAFVVPVDPSASGNTYFAVYGDQLVETSPGSGTYAFSMTTADFNGPIRSGRFSLELYSLGDPPTAIGGTFTADSGFYFDVLIPEPTSLGLLGLTGLAALRRRH